MIVRPRMRGFICTTAHPTGCETNVKNQIQFVQSSIPAGEPKRALVIGSSTGYGLASRITLAFGYKADTIGVFYEREPDQNRTGTAGWYNNAALERFAQEQNLVAESINGDAFSDQVKVQTIEMIKETMRDGKIDLVVYSLASPKRTDPVTGQVYSSVLKPIGKDFEGKTVDFHSKQVSDAVIPAATQQEIEETVLVMGGQDWQRWMKMLSEAGVLAEEALTIAYSYMGPEVTHAIYKDGTIGMAKEDLLQAAEKITGELSNVGGKAYVAVNKALVTQASSAIPAVPLYIAILYKVMKQAGTHENCIQQMVRLFRDKVYSCKDGGEIPTDGRGRIRMDDWELDEGIQQKVIEVWKTIYTGNLAQNSDIDGYEKEFYQLFGFMVDGVNYEKDVNPLY